MRFEFLISAATNPYYNLATEQALLKKISDNTVLLFFWQNDNTIVIGRNQDAYNECRLKNFLSHGGRLARRRSGGGAVYQDLGNLNFSILSEISQQDKVAYHKIIIEVLKSFGISAKYNGRNDILIDGRKCSGNAVYQDGNLLCQHGTILIKSNIQKMTKYLTPEKSKLSRNHVSSISSRVINLSQISDTISIEGIIQAFICATGAEEMQSVPDRRKIDKLMAFYQSEEWIFGGKR